MGHPGNALRTSFIRILLFSILFMTFACGEESVFRRLVIPRSAYTSVNGVNLRIDPFLLSSRVDVLRKGVHVSIKDRSAEKERIGKTSDYWYKVVLDNGVEGWVFGSSLSFQATLPEKNDLPPYVIRPDSANLPVVDIRGRWRNIDPASRMGGVELLLREDSSFLYQREKGMPLEGSYRNDRSSGQIILESSSLPEGGIFSYFFVGPEVRLTSTLNHTPFVLKRIALGPRLVGSSGPSPREIDLNSEKTEDSAVADENHSAEAGEDEKKTQENSQAPE